MKKLLSMMIVFALIFGVMTPMVSSAAVNEEPTEGWAEENGWTKNGVYYQKTINHVNYKLFNTINKYDDLQDGEFMWQIYVAESPDASGVVNIKSSIDGFPVTAVGKAAFSLNEKITECVIPEGVIVIGDGAFQYMEHLTMVKLPESLKVIDAGAFYGCPKLKTINIPSEVEYVARNAFHRSAVTGEGVDTLVFEGNAPEILYTSAVVGYSLEGVESSMIQIYEGTDGWDDEKWASLNLKEIAQSVEPPVVEPPVEEPGISKIYKDITGTEWYAGYVENVYAKGLMLGTDGYFYPEKNVTRAQCILTLYRLAGMPEVNDDSACDYFSDVPADKYYTDAICWAFHVGIAQGNSSARKMNPEASLTRQQMAVLFFRYAQYKNIDVSLKEDYSYMKNADKAAEYAKEAIGWCAATELLEGKNIAEETDLAPLEYATRTQFSKVLSKFWFLIEE